MEETNLNKTDATTDNAVEVQNNSNTKWYHNTGLKYSAMFLLGVAVSSLYFCDGQKDKLAYENKVYKDMFERKADEKAEADSKYLEQKKRKDKVNTNFGDVDVDVENKVIYLPGKSNLKFSDELDKSLDKSLEKIIGE